MWAKLFKAEFYKIIGHRWATGCMLWIFPLMSLALIGFFLFVIAVSSEARQGMVEEDSLWTENMIGVWDIPNNLIGRLLLLGFTAVLFGGEYQWNTWKSVVPRSSRVPLIIVKFIAVAIFVVFVFALTSVIWGVGAGIVTELAGGTYGPPVSKEVLSDFAEDYGLQAATTFISVIIAAGFAALAAMITRSILGSVIVGFIATLADTLSVLPLLLIAWLLKMDWIAQIYMLTPFFNLLNVSNWVNENQGAPFKLPVSEREVTLNLEYSLLILAVWVVGLIILTATAFQKQDIVN